MLAGGFHHDRQFMIIDAATNRFITQREHPNMSLIETQLSNDALTVVIPKGGSFVVPFSYGDADGVRREVVVWKSTCTAIDMGDAVADGLSSYLGQAVRLVKMDPTFRRSLNPVFALAPTDYTDFADGMPLLLCSSASLTAASAQAKSDLTMLRFRPNIIVSNEVAWEEDTWAEVQIGDATLHLVKPCTRCQVWSLFHI